MSAGPITRSAFEAERPVMTHETRRSTLHRDRADQSVRPVRQRSWPTLIRAGLVASLFTTTGCIGMGPLALPILSQAAPASADQLSWLHAHQVPDGLLITGRIHAARSLLRSRIGHLDVTASFADQRPDMVAETGWGTTPRRGRRAAEFKVVMRTDAPGRVTAVLIEYNPGPRCS